MTKTEALRRAQAQLRFGYYHPNMNIPHVYANCPMCSVQVAADYLPWELPIPALRTALVAHLIDEHPTEGRNTRS